jgi:HD-GYP domain-containing protein (c-di-GMP phosphodiesterase class II)
VSLQARIITIVIVALLVSVGLTTTITLKLQNKRMTLGKLKDIEVLCNIIHSSIENAMAQGKTEDVQKSLENIGKNPEIIDLRILSNDGYILKSKDPGEIGLPVEGFARYEQAGSKSEPYFGRNTISHYNYVLNKKQCYGCHDENVEVNGLIEVTYDMSRSRADMLAVKRFLILSNIMTVLLVVGMLSAMFAKYLMVPLKRFMGTIKAVEGGDWESRVKVMGDDELSIIGSAFNKMLDEVKSLYEKSLKKEKEVSRVKVELDHKIVLEELNAQLQYKVREVETANKAVLSLSKEVRSKNVELAKMVERLTKINEVGRVLTSIINTEELMSLIIKTTAETLRVDTGSIYVKKDENETLYMQYHRSMGVERLVDPSVEVNALYAGFLQDGKPLMLNEAVGGTNPEATTSAIGVPLRMKGQIIGGVLLEQKTDGTHFSSDELELLGTMANQAIVSIENAWLYETVKSNYFGTIQALVNALEASDRYTKGHSERVRYMGVELARHLGLDYREIELFEHAAILHDIGKIGIDTSVLNKEGKLSNAEFSLIRAHPIIGDEILGPIGTLQSVRATILQHHEKYDGTGYPYGITGDEITLKARILAVVDTFDAMMTDRPYRRALPITAAIDELKRGSGTQFDPHVVNSFLDIIGQGENIVLDAGYSLN